MALIDDFKTQAQKRLAEGYTAETLAEYARTILGLDDAAINYALGISSVRPGDAATNKDILDAIKAEEVAAGTYTPTATELTANALATRTGDDPATVLSLLKSGVTAQEYLANNATEQANIEFAKGEKQAQINYENMLREAASAAAGGASTTGPNLGGAGSFIEPQAFVLPTDIVPITAEDIAKRYADQFYPSNLSEFTPTTYGVEPLIISKKAADEIAAKKAAEEAAAKGTTTGTNLAGLSGLSALANATQNQTQNQGTQQPSTGRVDFSKLPPQLRMAGQYADYLAMPTADKGPKLSTYRKVGDATATGLAGAMPTYTMGRAPTPEEAFRNFIYAGGASDALASERILQYARNMGLTPEQTLSLTNNALRGTRVGFPDFTLADYDAAVAKGRGLLAIPEARTAPALSYASPGFTAPSQGGLSAAAAQGMSKGTFYGNINAALQNNLLGPQQVADAMRTYGITADDLIAARAMANTPTTGAATSSTTLPDSATVTSREGGPIAFAEGDVVKADPYATTRFDPTIGRIVDTPYAIDEINAQKAFLKGLLKDPYDYYVIDDRGVPTFQMPASLQSMYQTARTSFGDTYGKTASELEKALRLSAEDVLSNQLQQTLKPAKETTNLKEVAPVSGGLNISRGAANNVAVDSSANKLKDNANTIQAIDTVLNKNPLMAGEKAYTLADFGITPATVETARGLGAFTVPRNVLFNPELIKREAAYRKEKGLAEGGDVGRGLGSIAMKGYAQEMAQKGRFGDTMLAHISPEEAQMLQAAGGAGTINPQTGLPEYFSWRKLLKGVGKVLPFVLPFTGIGLGAQALISGLSGAVSGGKGFDFKRGLMSGLMSYGMGSLAQGAGAAANAPTPDITVPQIDTSMNPAFADQAANVIGSGAAPAVNTFKSIADVPLAQMPGQFLENIQAVGQGAMGAATGAPGAREAFTAGQGSVFGKQLTPTMAAGATAVGMGGVKAADEMNQFELQQAMANARTEEERERFRQLFLRTLGPVGFAGGGDIAAMVAGGATGPANEPRTINGAGDGMSDSVPATIEGVQEARLADGEFVIPADVVADLGNGSSNAGSKKLYAMMDRVRKARHGTTRQPPEVDTGRLMPA